ncbi:MAG TPA: hypothetical protein VF855_04445, partial [Acidimicrobiales bacterium]
MTKIAASPQVGARHDVLPVPPDAEVRALAYELAERSTPSRAARWLDRASPTSWAMQLATGDPELKVALFRFVDAYPGCVAPDDVLQHLHDELGGHPSSRLIRLLVRAAEGVP